MVLPALMVGKWYLFTNNRSVRHRTEHGVAARRCVRQHTDEMAVCRDTPTRQTNSFPETCHLTPCKSLMLSPALLRCH